jgi:hypothetical protein
MNMCWKAGAHFGPYVTDLCRESVSSFAVFCRHTDISNDVHVRTKAFAEGVIPLPKFIQRLAALGPCSRAAHPFCGEPKNRRITFPTDDC